MPRGLRLDSLIALSGLMLALGLILLAPAIAMAEPPQASIMDDVGSRVICMCGCGSVLNNCVHQECMGRDEMRGAISLAIAQGKSSDEIVNAFISQYGEQVLAAPAKKGFNLTAWIAPFLAIVIGGIAIFFILKAWVLKGSQPAPMPAPASPPVKADDEDEFYRQRVEAELKKYGEGL